MHACADRQLFRLTLATISKSDSNIRLPGRDVRHDCLVLTRPRRNGHPHDIQKRALRRAELEVRPDGYRHADSRHQLIFGSQIRSSVRASPDAALAARHDPHLVHRPVHHSDGHLPGREAEVGHAGAVGLGKDADLGAVRGDNVCFGRQRDDGWYFSRSEGRRIVVN